MIRSIKGSSTFAIEWNRLVSKLNHLSDRIDGSMPISFDKQDGNVRISWQGTPITELIVVQMETHLMPSSAQNVMRLEILVEDFTSVRGVAVGNVCRQPGSIQADHFYPFDNFDKVPISNIGPGQGFLYENDFSIVARLPGTNVWIPLTSRHTGVGELILDESTGDLSVEPMASDGVTPEYLPDDDIYIIDLGQPSGFVFPGRRVPILPDGTPLQGVSPLLNCSVHGTSKFYDVTDNKIDCIYTGDLFFGGKHNRDVIFSASISAEYSPLNFSLGIGKVINDDDKDWGRLQFDDGTTEWTSILDSRGMLAAWTQEGPEIIQIQSQRNGPYITT